MNARPSIDQVLGNPKMKRPSIDDVLGTPSQSNKSESSPIWDFFTNPQAQLEQAKSFGEGLLQGGIDLAEMPHNLYMRALHALAPNTIPQGTIDFQIDKSPKSNLSYEVARMLPSFALPGVPAAEMISTGASLIPKAQKVYEATKSLPVTGKLANIAESLTNPVATGAAYQGLYNANRPDSSLSDHMGTSGAISGVLAGLTKAPAGLINRYLSKMTDVPESALPEISNKNINQLPPETYKNVPVSDLAQSQIGSQDYKWLTSLPLSRKDAYNAAVQTNKELENYTNKVRDSFLGKSSDGNIKADLAKGVKSNYDNYRKNASSLYDKAFESAKDQNINIIPNELLEYSDIPEIKELLQSRKDINKSKLIDTSGQPLSSIQKPIELEKAHKVRSDLLQAARKGYSNKNTTNFDARMYSDVANALSNDIENSTSGNVHKLYKEANDYYKQNVAPYSSDNTIFKVATGKLDNPSNLSSVLEKRESPGVGAVLEHLTPDQRRLAFLDRVKSSSKTAPDRKTNTSASRFLGGFEKMDKSAQEGLLGDNDIKKLEALKFLNQIATPSKDLANPPKTGVQNVKYTARLPEKLAATYGVAMHPLAGIPLATLLLGGNKKIAQLLRSPQVKDAYLRGEKLKNVTDKNSIKRLLADYLSSGKPIATMNALEGN